MPSATGIPARRALMRAVRVNFGDKHRQTDLETFDSSKRSILLCRSGSVQPLHHPEDLPQSASMSPPSVPTWPKMGGAGSLCGEDGTSGTAKASRATSNATVSASFLANRGNQETAQPRWKDWRFPSCQVASLQLATLQDPKDLL